MSFKRILVAAAAALGIVAGLAPLGAAPAQAGQCDSQVHMWFWYGVRVEFSQLGLRHPTTNQPITHRSVAAPPVNIDSTYYSCTVAPTAGLSMKNPVLPGATLVSGRDDGATCADVGGHIVGLGVQPGIIGVGSPDSGIGVRTANYLGGSAGDHRTWLFPRDALNQCDTTVFVPGANSGVLPMDPTALGEIRGWTDRSSHAGGVSYYTIDR